MLLHLYHVLIGALMMGPKPWGIRRMMGPKPWGIRRMIGPKPWGIRRMVVMGTEEKKEERGNRGKDVED